MVLVISLMMAIPGCPWPLDWHRTWSDLACTLQDHAL